jgi:hypothetical protein
MHQLDPNLIQKRPPSIDILMDPWTKNCFKGDKNSPTHEFVYQKRIANEAATSP